MGSVADALDELFVQAGSRPPPPKPPPPDRGPKRSAGKDRNGPPPKQQNRGKRPNGRKPKRPSQPEAADKTNPSFDKSKLPGARLMYQRERFYQILCANTGARRLCEIVFSSIQFRDFRTAANVSLEQLTYCVVIAVWARQASVAIDNGYLLDNVPELSQLLKSVRGLQLPAVLAKYVETSGTLSLTSGVQVAPWFADRPALQNANLHQIDPDELLIQAGRPIPPNHWSIDIAWIGEWNLATTRPSRLGMHFRPILWSETTGSTEMIVTPTSVFGALEYTTPTAPQRLTDIEGQLGACYRWRSFQDMRHWPAATPLVCTRLMYGTEFNWEQYWSDVVVASYTNSDQN